MNTMLFANETNSPEKVTVKDVALAGTLTVTTNILFNSFDRIILNEDYANVNLQSFKKNLTGDWWWDVDDFATNQLGHPYQGSLYFNAGRANNLNFWQSLALAAFGSFTWEEFGETDSPSINDIITTPLCGAIFGETFHRLYVDVAEVCMPVAWIISPMDGLNYFLTGKSCETSGHTEEIDIFFHGGINQKLSVFGGGGFHIQYGNPVAHNTLEPFDLFIFDLDSDFSINFYKVDFDIDGFLWSHALYYENSSATLGIDLLYEGRMASDETFSNAAAGIKYLHSAKENKLNFYSQIDGIFMGTKSIYVLYTNRNLYKDLETPPGMYDFGYGVMAKTGFSYEEKNFGKLYLDLSASGIWDYTQTDVEGDGARHLITQAVMGYEHSIIKNLSLGLKDKFVYEIDYIGTKEDKIQLANDIQVYCKMSFRD